MRILTPKNKRVALGVAMASIPVGVLVQQHVRWESSPQSKKRMLTHQGVFWASAATGLVLLHKAFRSLRPKASLLSNFKGALLGLTGGLIAAQGFKSGQWIAERLFPHLPKSPAPAAQPPTTSITNQPIPKVYQPSYLRTWA